MGGPGAVCGRGEYGVQRVGVFAAESGGVFYLVGFWEFIANPPIFLDSFYISQRYVADEEEEGIGGDLEDCPIYLSILSFLSFANIYRRIIVPLITNRSEPYIIWQTSRMKARTTAYATDRTNAPAYLPMVNLSIRLPMHQILLCLADAARKAESNASRSIGDMSLLCGPPRLPSPVKTLSWNRSRYSVGNFHLSSRSLEKLRSRHPTTYFPITGKNLNALVHGQYLPGPKSQSQSKCDNAMLFYRMMDGCINLLSAATSSNE